MMDKLSALCTFSDIFADLVFKITEHPWDLDIDSKMIDEIEATARCIWNAAIEHGEPVERL